MKLAELVAELDAYFRVPDARGDDWSRTFEHVYPDPYWRDYVVAEPIKLSILKGKVHAEEIRRIEFRAPDKKTFVVTSENGSGLIRRLASLTLPATSRTQQSRTTKRVNSLCPVDMTPVPGESSGLES